VTPHIIIVLQERILADATGTEAVGPVVVVERIKVATVEVEVITVVRAVRRRGPIVAVAADIVHCTRPVVAVTRGRASLNQAASCYSSRRGA